MSAERKQLEVMRCVECGRTKAWTDGFPVRTYAVCWSCHWERHDRNFHPLSKKEIRRKRRAAVRALKATFDSIHVTTAPDSAGPVSVPETT